MTMRVGMGFDVHRFSEDTTRPLVLGGVVVPGQRGLDGHSDADVIAHSVADALLGAAALGDLGGWFPDTDPTWVGADSLDLLARVAAAVRDEGWAAANVDCAAVAELPLLAPYVGEMAERLSAAAGGPVTVKPRRAEGLGALGRAEGVACWAVALVERR